MGWGNREGRLEEIFSIKSVINPMITPFPLTIQGKILRNFQVLVSIVRRLSKLSKFVSMLTEREDISRLIGQMTFQISLDKSLAGNKKLLRIKEICNFKFRNCQVEKTDSSINMIKLACQVTKSLEIYLWAYY